MQALIVHDEADEAERLGRALSRRGFMVTARADQDRAIAYSRRTVIDLLVLKQVIGARHTTSVALAAEFHHPRAAILLLTNRPRSAAVELFELIPSLHAIMGARHDATTLAALAIQAVQNPSETMLVLSPQTRVQTDAPLRVA